MMTPSRTVSTSVLRRMFRGCERAGGIERSPVGVHARRVARSVERGEPQLALADGNAHRAAAACVEVGMRREKSLLLGFARALAGEAVHVMMAVALDVRYPEKADERQILLQREPGGGGEIGRASCRER